MRRDRINDPYTPLGKKMLNQIKVLLAIMKPRRFRAFAAGMAGPWTAVHETNEEQIDFSLIPRLQT
jgi:hypothetical protein